MTKIKKPILIVLAGLTGSGKSTVAKALSKELSAEVVRRDAIRLQLRKAGKDYKDTSKIAFTKIKHFLSSGKITILDSDNAALLSRKKIIQEVKKNNVDVIFVYTYCPIDILIGRIISKDQEGFFNDAGTEWEGPRLQRGKVIKLREMWRRTPLHYSWSDKDDYPRFTPKKIDFADYTIDTSGKDVKKKIKEIAQEILKKAK